MLSFIAAITACLILLGLSIFQILLISGLPLGKYAWGGYHEVLPKKLRIASGTSILIYFIFGIIILFAANILNTGSYGWLINILKWILVAYFALGVFMNGISQSKKEKLVMTPIAAILFICSLVIALQI